MDSAASVVADASAASALLSYRPGRSPTSKTRAKSAKLALGMAFGPAIAPTEREATRSAPISHRDVRGTHAGALSTPGDGEGRFD